MRIGRTSITVNVEVFAERRPDDPRVVKVTEATLTYVAIDRDGRPRPVPNIAAARRPDAGGGRGARRGRRHRERHERLRYAGIILAAALVPLIGIKAVIPVLAVAGIIINAGRFWFYRTTRPAHASRCWPSCPSSSGTWIYSVLDVRSLGTVLGLAVMSLRRVLHARQIT